ncbi:MAG TPA: Rv2175c family DNA-binding protein [Pseudolysinimonas sp.]|nr:Rv2175c family DNA-binding protein [Pseudolysinimonas sp.]
MTTPPTEWLTVPDLVDLLGIPQGKVRRLIDDRFLLSDRVDGVLKVPAAFVVDGHVLDGLHGTIIVLSDAGFRDDEALRWLLEDEESLGTSPVKALAAGRKAEVRRVAQALGF